MTSAAAARVLAQVGIFRTDETPTEPTLPLPDARLFTLTELELHDLTYHAVTTYLRSLSGMTREKAHQHAARIADRAVTAALASDYVHVGPDPRA